MRFDEGHESHDLIDRRDEDGGRRGRSGLLGLAPVLLRGPVGVGLGLLAVGAMIAVGIFRRDPDDGDKVGITETTSASVGEEKEKHLAAFVLDDAQQTWRSLFARAGKHYESAQLVLFRKETSSACGFGQTATGPFYCPSDDHVYVDLAFNNELATRFGAKGDFAQAYVLAHEIGHHVQNQLGIAATVKGFRRNQRDGEAGANVRLELQADCYAGIWAHATDKRGVLEAGDIDEAMAGAAAVGDDHLKRLTTGHVSPETFTHGTAEQRHRWFMSGYQNGDLAACDTFSASGL